MEFRTEILQQINKRKEPFEKCIIRIRENMNDLVYYKGNKAFEIDKEGKIKIDNNVYKCNTSDIANYLEKNKKKISNDSKDRIELCEEIVNKKVENIKEISNYIDFSMNKIEYEYVDKSSFLKEQFDRGLQKFKTDMKEMLPEIDLKQNADNSIEFDKITNYMDILKIQCLFILDLKIDETTSKTSKRTIMSPKFNDFVFNVNEEKVRTIDDFKNLFNIIKTNIKGYSGKAEIEKKYQHQFMLKECESKDIFCNDKYTELEGVEYFEQEYTIINKDREVINKKGEKNKKDGRVDCVFYRVKNNRLVDIYLIELKVDSEVILGSNGVMTHLDDIKYFINDDTQKKILWENIKYRYNKIYNKSIEKGLEVDENNINYHFYTVIGFTNDADREVAKRYLEYLKDKKEIFDLCNRKKTKDGKKAILDKYFENSTIYDLVNPIKDKCTIKFFFEKSNWDKENISTEFKDVTKELYNDFKK